MIGKTVIRKNNIFYWLQNITIDFNRKKFTLSRKINIRNYYSSVSRVMHGILCGFIFKVISILQNNHYRKESREVYNN